jgi:cytochrome P450
MTPTPVPIPLARERLFDPDPLLGRLREQHPLHPLRFRGGEVGWLVTSHALVRKVLTDPRFSLRIQKPFPNQDPDKVAAIVAVKERERVDIANLLGLDPPEHTRIRRLLAGQFSIDRMSVLAPRIERVVDERLDAMEASGGPLDLVKAFAAPVALATHCMLLGVPLADGARLERVTSITSDPAATADEVTTAVDEFRAWLRDTVAWKRREPADDMMSFIVGQGELSDDEVVSILLLLFLAGVDTAATMLATGPFALLCHPEQLALLRADPELIDEAVEELMRYLTIFQVGALTRTAAEDVELEGMTISAGQMVTVSLAAANRDPQKFADPDVLDLTRNARGQLGFGHGVHVCLGQHLARQEMQIGIGRLLRRFPTLRLAVPIEEVPLSTAEHAIFAAQALPVTWDAPAP